MDEELPCKKKDRGAEGDLGLDDQIRQDVQSQSVHRSRIRRGGDDNRANQFKLDRGERLGDPM